MQPNFTDIVRKVSANRRANTPYHNHIDTLLQSKIG